MFATNYLQQNQHVVLILTWIAYASTYLLRKPLGVVKNNIADDFGLTKTQLGYLDMALLLPYAVVQITCSSTVDKFGARKTLGLSLLVAALSMIFFGQWHNFPVMLGLMFINGAAQSLAWPSCVKALGDTFSSSQLNSLFGPWGTCVFAGGIAGSACAVYLQALHPWRVTFLIPAIFVGYISILIFLFLQIRTQHELPTIDKPDSSSNWLTLWSIGLVKETALAMFCVKIVRYCMYMWLPMFLHEELKYSQVAAGLCATVFEIGAVFGSVFLPYSLDKLYGGGIVRGTSFSIFFSALSFLAFFLSASFGQTVNMICIFMAGLTNGGTDSILSGIIPTNIAENSKDNSKGAICGLINGLGSVGTILEGPIIGFSAEYFGWSSVFWLMVVISLSGGIILQNGAKHLIQTNQ